MYGRSTSDCLVCLRSREREVSANLRLKGFSTLLLRHDSDD